MADKPGIQTSEFRWGALTAIIAAVGEPIGLFDTSSFNGDPVLSLIYSLGQLLVIGSIAVGYMKYRKDVKISNGNSAEGLIDAVKRNLDQKR